MDTRKTNADAAMPAVSDRRKRSDSAVDIDVVARLLIDCKTDIEACLRRLGQRTEEVVAMARVRGGNETLGRREARIALDAVNTARSAYEAARTAFERRPATLTTIHRLDRRPHPVVEEIERAQACAHDAIAVAKQTLVGCEMRLGAQHHFLTFAAFRPAGKPH